LADGSFPKRNLVAISHALAALTTKALAGFSRSLRTFGDNSLGCMAAHRNT
jgi:hypothetical protein